VAKVAAASKRLPTHLSAYLAGGIAGTPDRFDQPIRARMPLLERYAYLTQIEEAGSFSWKHEIQDLLAAEGGDRSAAMISFDISDEMAHVKYGTKWIPELQKALGDIRTMQRLVEDAREMRERVRWKWKAELPPKADPLAGEAPNRS
jgi:hypothetical protein